MFARSFFNNPQKHRLKTFLALFGLIVASLATIIFLKNPKMAEAGWPPTAQEWLKRKQLTLVNNSGQTLSANTTYSLTVNTKELYDNGDIQADCQDLRVYYQPDSNTAAKINYYVEVPAGLTCATSEATTIHFPLQADLTNGSQSGNYYLYFKNPTAQSESSIAAFDIGDKKATFYCGFRGGTDCVNQEGMVEPTTESGAIRYGGRESALQFDGKNDSVTTQSLGLTGQYTFEYWIKSPKNFNYAWNSNGIQSSYLQSGIRTTNFTCTHFSVEHFGNGTSSSTSWTITNFCDNEWHHFALTYDGISKANLFVNGISLGEKNVSFPVWQSHNCSFFNFTNSQTSYFIDEIRVSNTIRYTENFTPQTTPFVRDEFTKLLLHFDENGDDPRNTGKAIDDSGNGNHGTITGAKYVTGIVGIDSSTQETGALPTQSYASHQGIFLEEATTNLIPNPSFEHSTYNTGWSIGAGATASENTTAPYYKFGAKSLKLVASADTDVTALIDPNSTNVHYLYAYVYNATSGAIGGTVDNSVAQIIWEGNAQTGTSYTDMGGGWWRIKYSANTTDSNNSYGIKILGGKTVYIDGFQLSRNKINHVDHVILDSYTDGSLGTGYSWSGTAHESASTRGDTDLRHSATNNVTPSSGSISFWLKPNQYLNTNSEFRIIQIGGYTGSQNGAFELLQGGGPWNTRFQIRNNTGTVYTISKSGIYSAGVWRHIVLVWDENDIRFYSDGASQGTPITSAVMPTSWYTNQIIFGPNFLTGYTFSDFRIFDSALSSSEVASLYYSGLGSHQIQTGYTEQYTDGEPPTSMWRLDEGSGSTIYDSIGSYHGALGTGDSAPVWADGASCISSSCLSFDGTNDYALIDSTITGLKSLSFWVKPATTSTSVIDLNGNQTVTINNNTVLANNFSSPSIYVNGQATTSLNANKWSHVLITSNASFAASNLKLGQVGGNFFSGSIDEIKVFPYVLSADQIKKELNLGKAVSFGEKPETAQVTPISSKLVAYWKFDEGYGTTAHDSSGNNKHATLGIDVTKPTWINEGKVGKALSFDGAANPNGDYATANIPNAIKPNTGSFSISAWVKKNGNTGNSVIAAKFGYHGGLTPSGGVSCNLANNSNQNFSVAYPVTLNQWNHYVCMYDQSNSKLVLFVNGKKYNETGFSGTLFPYSDVFYIGGNGGNYAAKVDIDELKIYNYALSEGEVRQDYNQGMAAVMGQLSANTGSTASGGSAAQEYCVPGSTDYCAPPVAEWNFEENTGTIAHDTSGNGNDGTITGASWAKGVNGGAGLRFDGTNDYIDLGNPSTLTSLTYPLTISFWAKPNILIQDGIILSLDVADSNSDIAVGIYNTENKILVGRSTYRYGLSGISSYLAANSWQHWTVIFIDTTNIKFYLDGTQKTVTDVANYFTATNNNIGARANGTQMKFDGLIDDVKIYSYARTPAQIAWDYNRGGPVGHWRFDECEGTAAHDVSGNDNHGTINIGATAPQTSVGTCTSGNSAHAWYNGRNGKYNSSLNFDGVDDWVDCGSGSDFNSSTLTYSFWYKSSFGSIQCLATKYKDDNNKLQICSNYVGVKEGSWKQQISLPGGAFDGSWHHLTVVAGTSGVYVYYDGVLTGSDGTSSDLSFLDDSVVEIGRMTAGYPFNGQIDDVRVYNYALTPLQIKTLYNDGAVRFGE